MFVYYQGAQAVKYWETRQVKTIDLQGEQINDPSSGRHYISVVAPSNPLISVLETLEGLFELTWFPSSALNSPRVLLLELQEHRQVHCAGCGGPRTPSTTADAKLDCAFFENALFYTVP